MTMSNARKSRIVELARAFASYMTREELITLGCVTLLAAKIQDTNDIAKACEFVSHRTRFECDPDSIQAAKKMARQARRKPDLLEDATCAATIAMQMKSTDANPEFAATLLFATKPQHIH
ncbi:hypothetical protein [Rhodocyclus tenuis]|uniref:Uncharacterized protein n=1 Tax=Rhodocyclus tenuis TaxID=1066 RepID=A0A840GHK1_RHOTE|nr:hypothetical protein [Rhodocyclus tenuis]MBB4247962.1 hypothetical protein [Rhodocyclus tenuis]